MTYRYILEPYKGINSRFHCPGCGKKRVFSRYIDTQENLYLGEHVGRCNREIKCGYHFTPKQFFDNPISDINKIPKEHPKPFAKEKSQGIINTIPKHIMDKSLKTGQTNNFVTFLKGMFGAGTTKNLIEQYQIGTSKKWEGATVFWQIDTQEQVRSGKIMLYNPNNGKRIKKPFPHISWVHSALGIQEFHLKQCFFGAHLLQSNIGKPIAIVESEKTAIISSVFLSDFIWVATGSLSNLTYENTRILKGRQVVLFPDLNGYQLWKDKIANLYPEVDYQISDLLEQKASEVQKEQSWDIADYLVDLRLKP